MKVYLLLAAIAMALTILLTPVVRWGCLRFNILPPLRGRDLQKKPIPRLGGVAMTLALIITMALASRIPYMAPLFEGTIPWAVMAGAGAMCVLGIVDDIIELDWMAKLGGQVLIAGGMAPHSIAVLMRTNGQSQAFEEALGARGIAVAVAGGKPFFARDDVRTAISRLRAAAAVTAAVRRPAAMPPAGAAVSRVRAMAATRRRAPVW